MSLADELMASVIGASDESLKAAAHQIAANAIRNMPVGDPDEDPDPSVAMRENTRVERAVRHGERGDQHVEGWRVVIDTPYAAKQELDMRLKHPRGGGSRFLQRALQQMVPTLDDKIARKVAEEMFGFSPNRSHKKGRSRG